MPVVHRILNRGEHKTPSFVKSQLSRPWRQTVWKEKNSSKCGGLFKVTWHVFWREKHPRPHGRKQCKVQQVKNGQEKSCQIRKEDRERKKEDRSTYCVTTKWFSAAQQLIESEINCVFLCSLLAATQWMILFFVKVQRSNPEPSLFIFFVVWKLTSITPLCRSVLSFDTSVQCLVWLPRNRN